MRSQSAMEYLMTYGWAILIIAVVLGAIYSLGLFNTATLAPRAQPGACEVLRPNGAGTTQYISLAGSCTNELPEYVLEVKPGYSPVAITPSSVFPTITAGSGAITVTGWLYLTQTSSGAFFNLNYPTQPWFYAAIDVNGCSPGTEYYLPYVQYVGGAYTDACVPPSQIPINQWIFTATELSYNSIGGYLGAGGKMYVAINPITYPSGNAIVPSSFGLAYNNLGLGTMVSNFQVYNTVLDANSVQALYSEGIGGAPISLQNLVGWWPLNGNANDYSGNLQNGQTTQTLYVNQWASGYTAP